jgi:hypothetical protein
MRYRTALFSAFLVATGCGLGDFDVTEGVAPQTIPGASVVAAEPSSVFETTMPVNWSDLPSGKSWANAVTLRSAVFKITSPPAGTFDFVQSVALFVSAPTSTTLAEVQIATGQPTPGSGTLTLTPTAPVDLLRYVKAGAVVRATGTGVQPADTTTFDGQVVLTVHL